MPCIIIILLPHKQTDRQTNKQTDVQTDRSQYSKIRVTYISIFTVFRGHTLPNVGMENANRTTSSGSTFINGKKVIMAKAQLSDAQWDVIIKQQEQEE